ncbi:hypothetical protein B0H14DRAFT_2705783, partial [Mycena olivaceomarginata]
LLLSLRPLWWRNLGISVYLVAYFSQASLYLCLLASGTPCDFCDGLWTKSWHLLAVSCSHQVLIHAGNRSES